MNVKRFEDNGTERQNRQRKKVTKCITIHGSIKRTFEEAQNFAYPLYINNSVMLTHLNSVRAPHVLFPTLCYCGGLKKVGHGIVKMCKM